MSATTTTTTNEANARWPTDGDLRELLDSPYPLSNFYEDMRSRARVLDTCGSVNVDEFNAQRVLITDLLARMARIEQELAAVRTIFQAQPPPQPPRTSQ